MWEIFESTDIDRLSRRLPHEVLKRYEKWKDVVTLSGLEGLKAIKGFHDEKLKGEWSGFRSSRLGDKYRVLYKAEARIVRVYVITITAHDYRRR